MKRKTIIWAAIAAISMASTGCEQPAPGYITQSDAMVCGQSTFVVTSTCIPAREEMALNQCKPQQLRVKTVAGERQMPLPQMPPETVAALKKSGRDPGSLYVTEFGCTQSRGANVAVLYYSAGGAPLPDSEVWVEYDENGTMRGHREPKLDAQARAALDRNMQHVRSIMPLDPVVRK